MALRPISRATVAITLPAPLMLTFGSGRCEALRVRCRLGQTSEVQALSRTYLGLSSEMPHGHRGRTGDIPRTELGRTEVVARSPCGRLVWAHIMFRRLGVCAPLCRLVLFHLAG